METLLSFFHLHGSRHKCLKACQSLQDDKDDLKGVLTMKQQIKDADIAWSNIISLISEISPVLVLEICLQILKM